MTCKRPVQIIWLCLLSLLLKDALAAEVSRQADEQLFTHAVELSANGQWQKAETIYRELISRHDDWPEPRNNLAILLLKAQRLDEARDMLEQAVSAGRSYKIAQKNRTRLYNYLASQAYDKALGEKKNVALPEMQLIETLYQPPVKVIEKLVEKTVEVVVEKPVAAEPASKTSEAVEHGELHRRISQQLSGWANAWSQGDVEHYLQAYSSEFQPDDDRKTLQEWKNIRRARLRLSRDVNVSLDQLRVFVEPQGQHALVEFVQRYQSASYNDRVLKQLYMQKEQKKWLILAERVIKTY